MPSPLPWHGVVLAAGASRRFHSSMPKIFHPLAGQTLVEYSLRALKNLDPSHLRIVLSPQTSIKFLEPSWPGLEIIEQSHPQGTGDALRCALKDAPLTQATVMMLGDTPLIESCHLQQLLDALQEGAHIALLSFCAPDPTGYGRLMCDSSGQVVRIVEDVDATPQEKAVTRCWAGALALHPEARELLQHLTPHAQEFYVTDIVQLAQNHGWTCQAIDIPWELALGVNTRAQFAQAHHLLQQRWRAAALTAGVTLLDPSSTFFAYDTRLENDVTIHPFVTFGANVVIEPDVHILPFCHVEQAHIGRGSRVGPFAHLRAGVVLESKVTVGNFVELKAAHLGQGVNAKHLSYLGDAVLGAHTNVGAGTITCNYDGYAKHQTQVGKNVMIGAQTALVAPLKIEDNTLIGAGSVITQDVPQDALTLSRAPQVIHPEGALRYRKIKKNRKK